MFQEKGRLSILILINLCYLVEYRSVIRQENSYLCCVILFRFLRSHNRLCTLKIELVRNLESFFIWIRKDCVQLGLQEPGNIKILSLGDLFNGDANLAWSQWCRTWCRVCWGRMPAISCPPCHPRSRWCGIESPSVQWVSITVTYMKSFLT